jgi:hypothetical protein
VTQPNAADNGVMRKKRVLLIAAALIACLSAIMACSPQSTLVVVQSNLSVNEFTADINQSTAIVSGVVTNQGIWPVQNCVVVADFYNYQGHKVAANTFKLQKLEPGQACQFDIKVSGRETWDVARCNLSIADKK